MRPPMFVGVAMAGALLVGTTGAGAEKKEKDQFDPAVLKDLPDNTWVELGLPWRGGHEIPAVFDAANHLLFKYGGCTDSTPRINIEGSKRPNEGYSNSCWVVNTATGRWEMRRPRDVSFPKDRPANGCSRNCAYDSNRKLIWMYGGISNGGGGGDQWDLWTYDGKADTFRQWHTKNRPRGGDDNGGDVFVHDSARDLLIMPRGPSTWVYDPAANGWEERKSAGGPPKPGHYSSMAFDPVSKCLIYPRAVPTGNRAAKFGPGTPPGNWRPTEKKGYEEYEFQTWSYDPDKNAWTRLKPKQSPDPAYRHRFGFTYDSKNKVMVLVGGSSDTWDSREENLTDVWTYDVAANAWTRMEPAGPKPKGVRRECRHCAYDPGNNVVLFLADSLWAYRYKK